MNYKEEKYNSIAYICPLFNASWSNDNESAQYLVQALRFSFSAGPINVQLLPFTTSLRASTNSDSNPPSISEWQLMNSLEIQDSSCI